MNITIAHLSTPHLHPQDALTVTAVLIIGAILFAACRRLLRRK